MNLKLLYLLMLFVMTNGISAQGLSKDVFDNIYIYQKSEGDFILAEWFNKIHHSLNKSGKLNFVNKGDTILILEKLDIETGICYGSIWNRQRETSYKYYTYPKQKFDFSEQKKFPKILQKLISEWDVEKIRCLEKKDTIINSNNIYSFRIILRDTIEIDFLRFLEFSPARADF